MPKAPIQSRTLLFQKIRSANRNPTYRLLDWYLINTSIGPAVEPRSLKLANGQLTQDDANDSSFNAIMEVNEGALLDQFGTMGFQTPITWGQ